MNRERIAMMKDDAILISSGRGSVLDQDALVEAMQGGKLWGAALDVTEPEPLPADDPLWDAPNLVLTPHVAGGMRLELTRRNCIELAQENLRRYLNGESLINFICCCRSLSDFVLRNLSGEVLTLFTKECLHKAVIPFFVDSRFSL